MTVTTKSTSLALRYSKTLADLSTKVGANREITVCDEDKRPYLHDGVTAGGVPIAMKSELGASLTGAQIVALIDAELGGTDWRTGGGVPSPAPIITQQPVAESVTEPDAATFTVVASNASSYQWYENDIVMAGEVASTLVIATTSVGLDGNIYKVDVIGSSTVTSNTIALSVADEAIPPAITSQPTSQSVESPDPVTFTVVATDADSYQWYENDIAMSGEVASTLVIDTTSSGLDGNTYKVDVIGITTITSNTVLLTVAAVLATYTATSGGNIIAGIPQAKTAHVYIESGQSNDQGVAPRVDAPVGSDSGPIAGVKTWRRSKDGDMYSGTGQWYDLDYEYNQYEGRDQFGSVLKFGLNISDYLHDENNDIYIIKADGNGKAIAGWLDGGNEQGAMYAHINGALADLVADPSIDVVKIHGFYFDQGESDSDDTGLANLYESQLTRLISELRVNIGLPDLDVIIRQLDNTGVYANSSIVIAAQNAVSAGDSRVHIISGPYSYLNDNIHLDGASQNTVGDQRFNTITSVTKGQIYNA